MSEEPAGNRYVVEQAKLYAENCQVAKSSDNEEDRDMAMEERAMIVLTSNNLMASQLTEITIQGNKEFRFTDDLVTLMVEGLIKSSISLASLALTHHRINDVGFIQLCRLILVPPPLPSLPSSSFLRSPLERWLGCSIWMSKGTISDPLVAPSLPLSLTAAIRKLCSQRVSGVF